VNLSADAGRSGKIVLSSSRFEGYTFQIELQIQKTKFTGLDCFQNNATEQTRITVDESAIYSLYRLGKIHNQLELLLSCFFCHQAFWQV